MTARLASPLVGRPLGPVYEASFSVLGLGIHVLVVRGTVEQLDLARAAVEDLLTAWTGPRGDLHRLRASAGHRVRVRSETVALLALAALGHEATGGRYAPFGPDPGAVELDAVAATARLATGARLDLGGLERALVADVVARDLIDAGALGACVNVAGDVRTAGLPPRTEGWLVEVPGGLGAQAAAEYVLAEGGLAVRRSAAGPEVAVADTAWHAAVLAAVRAAAAEAVSSRG